MVLSGVSRLLPDGTCCTRKKLQRDGGVMGPSSPSPDSPYKVLKMSLLEGYQELSEQGVFLAQDSL